MTTVQDKKEAGSLLFIQKENYIFSALICEGKLRRFDAFENNASDIGGVYVGKVKNVINGMKAAFVEYLPGKLCFLPLDQIEEHAILSHRKDKPIVQGDEILLQIVSDAIKTKDPGASTQIALSGQYAVVTLGKPGLAYSKKIGKDSVSRISLSLSNEEVEKIASRFGVVIRTNAESADPSFILNEIVDLAEKLEGIIKVAPHRTCFSVLLEAKEAYLSVLKDYPTNCYDRILTDSQTVYDALSQEMQSIMPNELAKLSFYQDEMISLEKLYSMQKHLDTITSKKVYLPSGAYLVIEPTEALVSVDVNSGKCNMGKDREEAYYRINQEAATELVNQMILRNLSGMILVDFINMKNKEHEQLLLDKLNDLLKRDIQKSYVVDMTGLGLVEITRKKKRRALHEILRVESTF